MSRLVELPGRGVALEVDIHTCRAATAGPSRREAGSAGGASPVGTAAAAAAAATAIDTAAVDSRPLLLVLHPWAWLGGCMDDHVVVSVCRAAIASGLFSQVVRYNMRGAGQSGGSRAFFPSADADDLVALVQHCLLPPPPPPPPSPGVSPQQPLPQPRQQPQPAAAAGAGSQGQGAGEHERQVQPPSQQQQQQQQRRRRMAVVAYSYGGVVAGRAVGALRPHLEALALIALPMGTLCRIFLGSGPSWEAVSGSGSAAAAATVAGLPRLVCCGEYDQFTDVRQLTAAVEKANLKAGVAAAAADVPGEPGGASASNPAGPAAADGSSPTAAVAAAAAVAGGQAELSEGARLSDGAAPAMQLAIWPGCDHFFGSCLDPVALAASGLVPPPPAELPEAAGADGAGGREGGGYQGGGPVSANYMAGWLATRRPAVPLADYVVRWLGRVCAGGGSGGGSGAGIGVGVGGAGGAAGDEGAC